MNHSNYLLRRSTANQNHLSSIRFAYVLSDLTGTLTWTWIQHSLKVKWDKWHFVCQREMAAERKQDGQPREYYNLSNSFNSLWIFTLLFPFFPNKYAFPHLSLCHMRSHSSFFSEHMVLLYLLFLQNSIWKWCINTSCFSQLEKPPCSIVFLINTFSLVAVECKRGDITFSFHISKWEVGVFLISSPNPKMSWCS